MKFVAILFIGCVILLSAISVMADESFTVAKIDCCKEIVGKDTCHHKGKKDNGGRCDNQGCAMLFSCCLCGFFPVGMLTLPPNFAFLLKKPAPLYKAGDLCAYHKADWKPPKDC